MWHITLLAFDPWHMPHVIVVYGVCLGDQIITKTKGKGPNRNFLKLDDRNDNTRKGRVPFRLFTQNFKLKV